MNGYKTSGDWTDITSIDRNEVVFEGRHKSYGAFYIRQRYQNALLFSLFSAISFVGLCSFIPYLFKNVIPPLVPASHEVVTTIQPVVQPKSRVIPPIFATPPRVQPPKSTVPRFAPPVITRQPVDSNPPIRPTEHVTMVPTGTVGTGTTSSITNTGTVVDNTLSVQKEKPLMWVSEMPKFPNGKIDDYLAHQLQYPAEDASIGLQGTVFASFVIEPDGSVSTVTLVRGIANAPDLNKEALRVLSEMPKWIPGKQDGHPVRVQFVVPIHFKVQ